MIFSLCKACNERSTAIERSEIESVQEDRVVEEEILERNIKLRAVEMIKNKKLSKEDTVLLNFSLGKAYEDLEDYKKSFKYLKIANDFSKKNNIKNINFIRGDIFDEICSL